MGSKARRFAVATWRATDAMPPIRASAVRPVTKMTTRVRMNLPKTGGRSLTPFVISVPAEPFDCTVAGLRLAPGSDTLLDR